VKETTLQTPRSVKKVGEEVLQVPEQRSSPAAHDEDHGEAACSPAAHGGPWWSRYPPKTCGRPHARAGVCLKEAVTLWGALAGAGSWHDLQTRGEREAHAGTGLLAGFVTPWGTHTRAGGCPTDAVAPLEARGGAGS